ncbi:hypothetical protein PUNSTDRAFT_120575 [Punctularia strigosozonata HHB-11173 SS5]|uniref:uncharacterized protein n=1 Tax=Punctularia strigosozonata (strain HHB-11173) TaxID=741275 RepID=UPI00044173E5|nr:uncharacterized protein PUNSTDRAFT_120575 [Punctularia strigosozonata HHB-11173 SS5]EIN09271.1 hypothetical protein PUNSTDRAFT_120575 [Punctularia strigosozonata HHB-11173 SS5]
MIDSYRSVSARAPPTSLAETHFGLVFVGFCIATALLGFTASQAFRYLSEYRRDPLLVRVIVALLVVVETAITGFTGHTLYYILITRYADVSALAGTSWGFAAYNVTTSVVIFAVQMFFCYRSWRLSRGESKAYVVNSLLLLCIFAGFVVSLVSSAKMVTADLLDVLHRPSMMILTASGIGLAALGDVLITVSLYLYIGASRMGFRQTEGTIMRMCNFVLTRGVLILLVHVFTFVTFVAADLFTTLLFHQQLSKLYCFTFFVLLLEFEPFRLAARESSSSSSSSSSSARQAMDGALGGNIVLKVELSTDSDDRDCDLASIRSFQRKEAPFSV